MAFSDLANHSLKNKYFLKRQGKAKPVLLADASVSVITVPLSKRGCIHMKFLGFIREVFVTVSTFVT